jgi:hypothetical protein
MTTKGAGIRVAPTSIALLAALGLAGCWPIGSASFAVEDDTGTADDTDSGESCPFECASVDACLAVGGAVLDAYECEDPAEVCCDWAEWCPYDCSSQEACDAVGGDVVEGFVCENVDEVCCDWTDDTETASDSPVCPFDCLVEPFCETLGGVVQDGYDCPGWTICCDWGGDADVDSDSDVDTDSDTDSDGECEQPPNPPSGPDPFDGAVDVDFALDVLDWTFTLGATSWDVWYGTECPPPSYPDPGFVSVSTHQLDGVTLVQDQEYCWQVVAIGEPDCYTAGDVWTFTTVCDDPVEGPPAVTSLPTQNFGFGTTAGTYTLTFSEDVLGVGATSLTWTQVVGGGTMDAVVQIDPQTYEVQLSGMADGDVYTLAVPVSVTDLCDHTLPAVVEIQITVFECIEEFGGDSSYLGCEITHVFEDISETGTLVLEADESYSWVPIGFDFSFYTTDAAYVALQTNGAALFTNSYLPSTNCCLPTSEVNEVLAAVFWDDLDSGNGGDGVYYQVMGSAPDRRFIAQWDTEHAPSSEPARFQMVLHETSNHVEYRYLDADFGDPTFDYGASAAVGIQRNPGQGVEHSCDAPALSDELSLIFYRL